MKDKCFILYGNPCSSALSDPDIQTFEDAKRHPVVECFYAAEPSQCAPPRFGCVRVAGARMARAVVRCRTEASERSLLLQRDFFRLQGPLPRTAVEAYIDPERAFQRLTDPERVVRRVWEHARAVLDLRPGERVRRSVRQDEPPASGVHPAMLRHIEQDARGEEPSNVGELCDARSCGAPPQSYQAVTDVRALPLLRPASGVRRGNPGKGNPMPDRPILVPLDGSQLSEYAVPYAVALAKATGARLHLATVCEDDDRAISARVPEQAGDLLRNGEEGCGRYLTGVAERVRAQGVRVTTRVLIGDAVDEILHTLKHDAPRMLVMATHGRSGLGRWRYGSVAGKLAREVPVPAMMIGPRVLQGGAPVSSVRRILVPLDGSSLAESALLPARELAEAFTADLVLAQVLRWAIQTSLHGVPEVDTVLIEEDLVEGAQQYLARAKERLGTERRVKTVIHRGTPADILIGVVEAERIDLVVMASHARGGLARVMLGSVADRLLHGKAPVLLIRPGIERTEDKPDLVTRDDQQPEPRLGAPQRGKRATSAVGSADGDGRRGNR